MTEGLLERECVLLGHRVKENSHGHEFASDEDMASHEVAIFLQMIKCDDMASLPGHILSE